MDLLNFHDFLWEDSNEMPGWIVLDCSGSTFFFFTLREGKDEQTLERPS